LNRVYFKTFGCRTNIFDTQIMIENLKDFEVVNSEAEADIVVINSCTVTNSADSTVRNYINGLSDKRVFFTGCGVHSQGEALFKSNKIFGLFGHSLKEDINSILKSEKAIFEKGNLETIDKTIIKNFVGKSRAFLKIQEGCDFRCSYCIIPYSRGNSRSVEEVQILEQIKILVDAGFSEFILTGTNVGSYRGGLAKLIKQISKISGVIRVRVGSLEPIQIDSEFLEILGEDFMSKHLHIALQHTSKEMLKIMNRRNELESDLALFNKISKFGYALGTDFIVGHPYESEAIYQEALKNIKEFPLTHIHLFSYSKRDNTPSALMKEIVKGDIAKARLKELQTVIDEKNYEFRKQKNSLKVLVEKSDKNSFVGLDEYFNKIKISSEVDLKGKWVDIKDYEVKKDGNYAKI